MRLRKKVIKKYNEGECYKFIGGAAKVPGIWHKNKLFTVHYTITLKEFKEITNGL